MSDGIAAFLPATLVGLVGGVVVGLTGVGAGSIIAAGLLIVFPDVAPKLIVGSATVQAAVMKLFGVLARRRSRFHEGRLGAAMAAGAIPMAAAGAWVSSRIGGDTLRPLIAIVLLIVGLVLLAQAVPRGANGEAARLETRSADPRRAHVGLVGAVVGFVAGLTSIGTGTLFVSALVGPLRMDAHRAVAVALLAGLLTLVVSGVTHTLLGHVDPALVGGILLGSIPGVLVGTFSSRKLSGGALRGTIGAGIAVAAVLALSRMGR